MTSERNGQRLAQHWQWLIWLPGALLALVLTWANTLQSLDSRLHDAVLRVQPASPPAPGITLIDIDEASLATLGPWPWPRPLLAKVMQNLREQGATLQAWDIALTDAHTGDVAIQAQLARGDIVIGQIPVLDPEVHTPPQEGRLHATPAGQAPPLCSQHPPLRGWLGVSAQLSPPHVGHLAATPDPGGQLRHLPAVICHSQSAYPQLALAAAQAAYPDEPWRLSPNWQPWLSRYRLQRGPWQFALDSRGQIPLPFARPHNAWPAISVQHLFNPPSQPLSIRGHTVIIGATALGLGDVVSTPYHPNAPGVSIHADLLSAARAPQPWPGVPWGAPLLSAIMALLFGAWLFKVRPLTSPRTIAGVTVLAAALPLLTLLLAWPAGVRLPAMPAVVALAVQGVLALLWQAWSLRTESQRLAQHLQSFMPVALARQIVQHNPSGDSLGHTSQGLVLALRIDGLKRWVASVDALHALGLTHAIHASAQTVVARHGGRVEHVMGDTLLLAWPGQHPDTAPSDDPGVIQNVIRSTDQILHNLSPVLASNETLTHPLSLQMAIDSGGYLVGIVGNADSRRSVMLGSAPTRTLAMLDLCAELASPVVFSEAALPLQPCARLHSLGHFLLPEQSRPMCLYRLAEAAPAA